MDIVLLQSPLKLAEIDQLLTEFPQYLFLSFNEHTYKNLSIEDWGKVEILYGNALTKEELARAHQLHWIHTPSPFLGKLCLEEVEKQGNILISSTREENAKQIGEYVMGGVLAFAKQLFRWKDAKEHPHTVWDSDLRNEIWTLKDRLFLQVGLGTIGKEITHSAKEHGMNVWGALKDRSFQPYCDKVFSTKNLHSVLPNADVVCIALPRGAPYQKLFQKHELELMKEDSILVIIGPHNIVDEKALIEVASKGKFRGILMDAHYEKPPAVTSKLWKIPNLIITPDISPRPKSEHEESFRNFRYNLRQYLHGNFFEMRNLLSKPSRESPKTSESINL